MSPTMAWDAWEREGDMVLAYGEPNTDNVRIMIICNMTTGRTRVTPSLDAAGLAEERTGTIGLSGPGGTALIIGSASENEMTGDMELTGNTASARDVVQTLSKAGTLTVTVPGTSEKLPLGPTAAAALVTFRRNCPSAR